MGNKASFLSEKFYNRATGYQHQVLNGIGDIDISGRQPFWGQWEAWSVCTRQQGERLRTRSRECENLRPGAGYCQGTSMEFQPCTWTGQSHLKRGPTHLIKMTGMAFPVLYSHGLTDQ